MLFSQPTLWAWKLCQARMDTLPSQDCLRKTTQLKVTLCQSSSHPTLLPPSFYEATIGVVKLLSPKSIFRKQRLQLEVFLYCLIIYFLTFIRRSSKNIWLKEQYKYNWTIINIYYSHKWKATTSSATNHNMPYGLKSFAKPDMASQGSYARRARL